ncbi:hypothetical protein NDU88_006476 [Pleurodeles waltl]|uniref:Uncharacterized protein n=1 Tax=Pleurodeles waltl TaxID=8319 RepID=A0AAV7L7L0_PLEWA|nr:hypothetical protein NDU88_006476 [Pleurodeles waltl]
MQRMSHVEMLDAGELQRWIRPISLGSSNVADCVKMVLPGPRRDLTEEAEGAPNTGGIPQMTRQHPQRSQDTETKKVKIAVAAELQNKVPRRQRTIQRVEHRRIECWGPGPGCAQRILANSAQRL